MKITNKTGKRMTALPSFSWKQGEKTIIEPGETKEVVELLDEDGLPYNSKTELTFVLEGHEDVSKQGVICIYNSTLSLLDGKRGMFLCI